MLIDSHVNLHSDKYADDLDAVIDRARAAGVRGMLTISDRLSSTEAIRKIADAYEGVWRSVGVHPHHAKDEPDLTPAMLVKMTSDPKVIGVGECGLDFHYEYSPRDAQEKNFRAHIVAARETGLPLIIHTRDADARMLEILKEEYEKGPFTPLLHCYTGGPDLAEGVLAMDGYVSFAGIITFKNAEDIRAIASATPIDRIIIETDCPYLAPVPIRGRRNEPAFIVYVASKLAEIRGVSPGEIAAVTTENFFRLFARAKAGIGR